MVTHDPKAASYADRIVFLRDGREIDRLVLSPDDPLPQRIRQIIEKLEALEV
jgi:putative ABC transport system ATP-binding protein